MCPGVSRPFSWYFLLLCTSVALTSPAESSLTRIMPYAMFQCFCFCPVRGSGGWLPPPDRSKPILRSKWLCRAGHLQSRKDFSTKVHFFSFQTFGFDLFVFFVFVWLSFHPFPFSLFRIQFWDWFCRFLVKNTLKTISFFRSTDKIERLLHIDLYNRHRHNCLIVFYLHFIKCVIGTLKCVIGT